MTELEKSLIDDNYKRAQEIVSLPRNNSVKPGYRSFRRDFTPEEQKKILRRVSQVGVKQAADEFGASLNVVKGWLKEFERSVQEPVKEVKEVKAMKKVGKVKEPMTVEKTVTLQQQTKPKTSTDFTEQEKIEILARAKETSLTQAAREYGTARWVIRRWRSKSFAKGIMGNAVKEAKKFVEHKVSQPTASALKRSEQPVVEVQVKETPTAPKNFELENQILKKKVELLTKEFDRLKKAVTDLTELIE